MKPGGSAGRSVAMLVLAVAVYCLDPVAASLRLGRARADGKPGGSAIHVIGPGREKLVMAMLEGAALPTGCQFVGASIEQVQITANYGCAGVSFSIELRHPSEAKAAARTTAQFALVAHGPAPDALLDAVAAHVSAAESAWSWATAEAGPVGITPTPPPSVEDNRPAAEKESFAEGARLLREGRADAAASIYAAMAQAGPRHDVLAMLMTALYASAPDVAAAASVVAAVDARGDLGKPANRVPVFQAAMTALYAGEVRAKSWSERERCYRDAARLLATLSPAWDAEPRIRASLAVVKNRLGDDPGALVLADQALARSPDDPDLLVAHAEVSDTPRAAADLAAWEALIDRRPHRSPEQVRDDEHRKQQVAAIRKALQIGTPKAAARPVGLFEAAVADAPVRVGAVHLDPNAHDAHDAEEAQASAGSGPDAAGSAASLSAARRSTRNRLRLVAAGLLVLLFLASRLRRRKATA